MDCLSTNRRNRQLHPVSKDSIEVVGKLTYMYALEVRKQNQHSTLLTNKVAVNILLGNSFIDVNIYGILQQSNKLVACNSIPVSILAWKIASEDIKVVVTPASKATSVLVNATKTHSELPVAKKTWLKRKNIGTDKVMSKRDELLYFEPTKTVVRKGHLMPVKGVIEVWPEVPSDLLVANITNTTVHVPGHRVLYSSGDSVENVIDSEQVQTYSTVL